MEIWVKRIKQKREEFGLSQRELAKYVGMSHTTFCRYESGDIKDIKLETISKIADVLGCNPLWLGGFIDEDLPYANKQSKK